MGQFQFRRAESGASGQTAVTEEDIRRFVFPSSILPTLDDVVATIEKEREEIRKARAALDDREIKTWKSLDNLLG